MSRKGVSGKVITTVVSLIIAVFALVILWSFLISMSPMIKTSVENMVNSLRLGLCDRPVLNWPVINSICKFAVGS